MNEQTADTSEPTLFRGVSESAEKLILARLYGEPLENCPEGLYIPPEALRVFLESFEGPLDLLLYLIRKQKFDVMDIPMADLTDQYMRYVDMVRENDLELASTYLVMSATLMQIKSRLLLPAPPAADGGEPEDPRAELMRRLLEYEKIRNASLKLLGEKPFLTLEMLSGTDGREVMTVWFLALLELAKEGMVIITQAAPYAPLYVTKPEAVSVGDLRCPSPEELGGLFAV